MQADVIQRQYDDIIASHYDFDPQSVIGDSLDRAIQQIRRRDEAAGGGPWRVLDLGVGTGRFLEKLRAGVDRPIRPYGLDLSRRMIDTARSRIPDLQAAVDDATNLDAHFRGVSFDLVSTHFITGFVPLGVLAPKIAARLEAGGLWSFVGGTVGGFPALQQKANSKLVQCVFRIKSVNVNGLVCNPADEAEVVTVLEQNGFTVRDCETFRPALLFRDYNEFLEFGYYGGWLTPFLEDMGLHKLRPVLRGIMNKLVFPVRDHHEIVVALAQKT
jgi:SAM-dependent methyltransferase